MDAVADDGGEAAAVRVRDERLLVRIDALHWSKRGASPHENYRRERQHNRLVKLALAKGLIEA